VRFFFLLFCFFLPYSYAQTSSVPLEKITLQLQWKHQFEFAGFYAAKEMGFYEEVGLEVEFKEFDTSLDIVDEVVSKRARYGLSYSSLIIDYLHDKPIVLVANFFKQSPLVLVTQKEIRTPKDLKGKKVMGMLDSTHRHSLVLMLEKFGLTQADIYNVPRSFSLEDFIEKRVDAISVFTTNEIYELDRRGVEYNLFDPAAYGIKFYDLNLFTTQEELRNHPQRVADFRSASIRGWEYALEHKEELVELILRKYNPQKKSKEALLFEANQIEYLMLPNVYAIGNVDRMKVEAIRDGFVQSKDISSQPLKSLEEFFYTFGEKTFTPSLEQRAYLEVKKELRMCVDPNWMPLEKIEEGVYTGIGADMIKLVAQKIDIPVRLIPTQTWSESLAKVRARECDFLAFAEKTPNREEYLDFTTPFLKTPIVLATKAGLPFVDNLESIKGQKLALVKNYSHKELLQKRYKELVLVEVDSIQEGIAHVRQEKVFGFLDNSIVINHELHKNGIDDVAITGQFQESIALGIASRNDEPILHEILQKALDTIDLKTREEIKNRWSNISYQLAPDYRFMMQLLFFFVVLLGVALYWNLKLQEEIEKKERVKMKLRESETLFRTLFDIAPVLLDSFDAEGRVVMWNKECEKVFGWTLEELQNMRNPLEVFYPDISDRQRFLDALEEKNDKTFKEWHPATKSGKKIVTMWANIHMPNASVIHVGYDITKRREDETALRYNTYHLQKAKKELEMLTDSLQEKVRAEVEKNVKHQALLAQRNRLEQMGEMIENIAHQWRQPLAQINSSVLLLDAWLGSRNLRDATVESRLCEIESLTGYMSKTIDDFKNFFHPQKVAKEFFLDESLAQALLIVQGSFENAFIEVERFIPEKVACYGYPREFEQVILTVLNNAKDALLLRREEGRRVRIRLEEGEDTYAIFIEDNAGGIPKEHREKIFEPYFSTKHKSQGTGLGLYIAKMLMQEGLGGDLFATNKGDGASFAIYMPKRRING
jgi:PAS domain S-box-containing protein